MEGFALKPRVELANKVASRYGQGVELSLEIVPRTLLLRVPDTFPENVCNGSDHRRQFRRRSAGRLISAQGAFEFGRRDAVKDRKHPFTCTPRLDSPPPPRF